MIHGACRKFWNRVRTDKAGKPQIMSLGQHPGLHPTLSARLILLAVGFVEMTACARPTASAAAPEQPVAENRLTSSTPRNRLETPSTESEHDQLRFDLECAIEGRVVSEGESGYGTPYEPRWRTTLRYSVDLQAMQFCRDDWCSRGPDPLAAADANFITLYNSRGNSVKSFATVAQRDGRFLSRITSEDGWDRVSTGSCRKRPFSGWRRMEDRTTA
jgi:hypothetical protein